MKKTLMLIALLPALANADLIKDGTTIHKTASQSASKKSAVISSEMPDLKNDREAVYLETLEKLQAIEKINSLPATAAGGVASVETRSCEYARNVLLEYKLELEHSAGADPTNVRSARLKDHIRVWKENVGRLCQ